MITIVVERCTGCAACIEVCPTGALYLVDGKATVDKSLCRECEACVAVCPTRAIILTEQREPVREATHLPALRPEPEVIRIETQPALVPFRAKVLPVVGAALAWAGREILPSLTESLLDMLDRRTIQRQVRNGTRRRETLASGTRGGGRQHRHRRRGGNR